MTSPSKQMDSKLLAADTKAITQTVSNYIEGWYTGDADRMESCLHPDLVKREVSVHPQTGRSVLSPVSATWMVEYTRAGQGSATPESKRHYEITILAIWENIASVRMVASGFVDYLHLARFNDSWVIVNVLWQRRDQTQ